MKELRLAFGHALLDLRGQVKHLRLLFICLTLGIMVMGCIGSLIASVHAGINRDAKSLLGGDVEVSQIYKPLKLDATAFFAFNSEKVSQVVDMRAMAIAGDKHTLVEFKAVDNNYPLEGDYRLSKRAPEGVVFSGIRANDTFGVSVDQTFLDMLDLKLGDNFKIGEANFVVRGIIQNEPDRSINSLTLGPRVMGNFVALDATKLVVPGSMINYRYRLKLNPDVTVEKFMKDIAERFPDAHWNIRNWHDSSPGLTTMIDRLSLFFALTGMTALIVAGLGIANATSSYLWSRRHTIATMKCLGAAARHVQLMYLIQILIAGALSIAAGLVLAVCVEYVLLNQFGNLLPVQGEAGVYMQPLLLSAALGFTTVLLFSLMPILQSAQIKPAALFRGVADPSARTLRSPLFLIASALLLLFMVWLAILFTGTVKIPLYFAVGITIALALLYGLSIALKRIAQIYAHKGYPPTISMALANLARTGSATTSMVIALGLGISLMVALALIGSNLREQIERGLPENAPAFFLVDIQPSEIDPLLKTLDDMKRVKHVTHTPIVRGHIIKVNNVPVNKITIADNARWAIQNERGLTTSVKPPENASIVEGKWWRQSYHGRPLVSFDANLARGMGLKVGNTITLAALDKTIVAKIANLRDIQWGSMEMNFAIILSPGSLDGLPLTYIATVSAPPSAEKSVQDKISESYPTVGVVRVREVLNRISLMLTQVSNAVLITAAMTILCGVFVMAGAIHASIQKRLFDTAMLKVLGATRARILLIYLAEFALIALTVAVVASIIGSLSAYGVMQLMIFSKFRLMPGIILATLLASLVFSLLLGLAATQIALRVRPLNLLRNE